jgi:hypothetical protein
MSSNSITPQQILDAIQHVPEDRWQEVLQTIESLQTKAPTAPSAPSPVRTGTDLRGSQLIGIWSNRTDFANGHEFARWLRRQAEQRNQGPSDAAGH